MIPTQKKALIVLMGAVCLLPAKAGAATAETDSVAKELHTEATFREAAPSDIVGGISVVNVEENQKKDHTFGILDNMQGFVSGWNGASLWAMDSDNDGGYLVIVDGVPRDAAVVLGSPAAKGAILITTKHGEDKPLNITVNANAGWNVAKGYPEYIGSAEYMTMYNQARSLDGLSAAYSATDIYKTAAGVNPYRYPNVDFYSDEYIGKVKNRYDVTAQISGGNKRARYYTNISYFYEDDVFKIGEAKNNNTNRFSVRGNVDVDITDWLAAHVGTYTTFYNSRAGHSIANGDSYDDYWKVASTFRPNRISPLIPLSMIDPNALAALELIGGSNNIIDGKYFLSGTNIDNKNIFANYYAAGYNKHTARNFQFNAGIDINLGRLLKGLTFHTQFATDYQTSYNTAFNNDYAVYIPTWSNYAGTDLIVDLVQEGIDKKGGVQKAGAAERQQQHGQPDRGLQRRLQLPQHLQQGAQRRRHDSCLRLAEDPHGCIPPHQQRQPRHPRSLRLRRPLLRRLPGRRGALRQAGSRPPHRLLALAHPWPAHEGRPLP